MWSAVLFLTVLAGDTPTVIAHRGASGSRPEHTMEAYKLGLAEGADAIEPDLVVTADGHLIARHDLDLARSTDVAARFTERQQTRDLEGRSVTGWFSDQFTLAEVQTLRAREPRADRSTAHDGRYGLVTWPQLLAWALEQPAPVPLVPELKHVAHLQARGLDPIPPFLAAIESARYPHDQLWVQCFEVGALRTLNAKTDLRLVQLVGDLDASPADVGAPYRSMLTPDGLAEIATYAHAIGVHKQHIWPLEADETYGSVTSLVTDAHAAGLQVHVYTFRNEVSERSSSDPTPEAELQRFYALGVDAVFADHPQTAVSARDASPPKAP